MAKKVFSECVEDLQKEGAGEGVEGVSRTAKGLSFLLHWPTNKLAGHSFMVVGRRCVASGSGAKNKLL